MGNQVSTESHARVPEPTWTLLNELAGQQERLKQNMGLDFHHIVFHLLNNDGESRLSRLEDDLAALRNDVNTRLRRIEVQLKGALLLFGDVLSGRVSRSLNTAAHNISAIQAALDHHQ